MMCKFCNLYLHKKSLGPDIENKFWYFMECHKCLSQYAFDICEDELYSYKFNYGKYTFWFFPNWDDYKFRLTTERKSPLSIDRDTILSLTFMPNINPFNAGRKLKTLIVFS